MSVEVMVRPGGLMRCCLATINDAMTAATELPQEGDTLACKHHPQDGDNMVYRNGAWEWIGPKD